MKLKQIKKWFLRITIFLAFTLIVVIIYANYELKHMYGGYTEVVNTAEFDVVSKSTIIKNVNVLSPDGNHFIENQTVHIDNGKIISVDSLYFLDKGSLIIDGQNKYLIAGLIDSHVHIWQSPNDLMLYLVNGVTHIREMMGSSEHLKWREEIENGKRLGPKMFVASNKVNSFEKFDGWLANWSRGNIILTEPDEAKNLLKSLSDKGFDAVKMGSMLNKENYLAINKASRINEIPIIGHLPLSVGLNELWDSNQKEIAHIEEILKPLDREFGNYNSDNSKEFLQFITSRRDDVANNLLKNKITVITTISIMESFSKQKINLKELLTETQLEYVNSGLIEGTVLTSRGLGWLPEVNPYRLEPDLNSKDLLNAKIYWETYAKAQQLLLEAIIDKGVQILAGTDSNVPVAVAGFSLHDELKSLTLSGMTSEQALLSATKIPANYMKIKSGSILPNYRADLVLLNKNPLENIENTKTIEMVILNGKVFDRSKLDAILKAVKEANERSRNKDISLFIKEPVNN